MLVTVWAVKLLAALSQSLRRYLLPVHVVPPTDPEFHLQSSLSTSRSILSVLSAHPVCLRFRGTWRLSQSEKLDLRAPLARSRRALDVVLQVWAHLDAAMTG